VNYDLNETNAEVEHTILHEATHQLTHHTIRNGGPAVEKLNRQAAVIKHMWESGKLNFSVDEKVRERQEKYLTYIFFDEHGKSKKEFSVLQELTAFAVSNPDVQELLKNTQYNKSETMWDVLLKGWTKILESIGVTTGDNLLAPILETVLTMKQAPSVARVINTEEGDGPGKVTGSFDLDSFIDEDGYGSFTDSGLVSPEDIVSLKMLQSAGIISDVADIKSALEQKKNC